MQTEDVTHLHRIDPARNMARFYRMSSTPSLFGDICLVREWGRIGRPGRIRIDLYWNSLDRMHKRRERAEEAIAAREALSLVKRRRGHRELCGV